MTEPKVIAIAHRGASAYAPENTVASFDEAIRMKAPAVEFDVRLTADGVPVVLHDATVDRTTNGKGRIDSFERFDLLRLDAGSWFHPRFAGTRIPTFEEALIAIAPHASPIIEIKSAIDPALLESLLIKHNILEESIVQSFNQGFLKAIRMHTPRINLGVLADEWTPELIEQALALDAGNIMVNHKSLGPQKIADAQDAGLEVWTWTVNDVGLVAACAALDVTGIITDRPDLIRHK